MACEKDDTLSNSVLFYTLASCGPKQEIFGMECRDDKLHKLTASYIQNETNYSEERPFL